MEEAARPGLTIICQKPFCTSLAEARRTAMLAKERGAVLVIHENIRFQPWYRAIAEILTSGAIGQVYQAHFRLRPGDGQGKDAYLARQPAFRPCHACWCMKQASISSTFSAGCSARSRMSTAIAGS
ncbi:MAG: hypothetical protein R3D29_04465 [Nitratireductor sp.]